MEYIVSGQLKEWLERSGRHDLVDAGTVEADEEEVAVLSRECRRYHPNYTDEQVQAWSVYSVAARRKIPLTEQETIGTQASNGVGRVAASVEASLREFRALKGAFEMQHSRIQDVQKEVEDAARTISGQVKESGDSVQQSITTMTACLTGDLMKAEESARARWEAEGIRYVQDARAQDVFKKWVKKNEVWMWVWRIAVLLALLGLLAIHAHAQEVAPSEIVLANLRLAAAEPQQPGSQIYTIQFLNSSAARIAIFAAPFSIECSTNLTCTRSGSVLTMSSSGSGGGGTPCVVTALSIQYNNAGAFGCLGVGTTTTVLHGSAAGVAAFGSVVTADLNITGTTCTNQFVRNISSAAAGTCNTVNLANDVTGQLPIGAVGSAGLSGTSPVTVASTGSIGCATCNTSNATVSSIATTSPLGGGTITTTGTLTCTTCVTSAAALTSGEIMEGAGLQASAVDGNLDDGVSTANTLTYAGTAGVTAKAYLDSGLTASLPVCTSAAKVLSSTCTGLIPIGDVGSSGLSGSSPITINAAGSIGCSTCNTSSATVSSVATTAPITGGTITTTGTIACGTCATTTNGGALSGTSPVTVSAAGAIGCATCVTSSGGGAITGTAPIQVSAAGAVSLPGAAGEIYAGATPALTFTPTLGVSGTAGTVSLFPASGNFTTTLGSAATASNTVNFFASAPTTNHLVSCVTATTVCTLTDSGILDTSAGLLTAIGQIPIANVGSSGLSATLPIGITSAGAISTTSLTGIRYGNAGGADTAATAHNESTPLTCLAASGSGTAYTCTTSPTFAPADGDIILFQADVASTGAMTLNVNSSAADPVKKQGGGTAIAANDFLAGQDTLLEFDGVNWQMQGQTGNAPSGGVTSIATTSPITGGTITTTGTIACGTCVTSAASLTSNAVVIGGGSQASSTISADTTTTHALFATGTAPAFRAIAIGDLPSIPINDVVSATGAIATIADGNNPLTLNCALSSNSTACVTFGETTPSSGSGSVELQINTAAASPTIPFQLTQGTGVAATAAPLAVNVTGGVGGANAGATSAGLKGGGIIFTGGAGSNAGATSGTGGAGADITLTAGAGGTAAVGSTTGAGGNVILNPGAAGGTGTAGKIGVVQVAGANAGFTYMAQGATNTTANTNIPANSIIDQAPAAVTAYTITRPGAAPAISNSPIFVSTAGVESFTGTIPKTTNPNGIHNFSTSALTPGGSAGVFYYMAPSALTMPATYTTAIGSGTTMKWRFEMSKTGAGTGAFDIVIYMGTNGSISDTKEVTQSVGTATAALDDMFCDVILSFTSATAAYWSIACNHSALTAVGFGLATGTEQFNGTLSALTTTTASLIFGLGYSNTTGTAVITLPLVEADAYGVN